MENINISTTQNVDIEFQLASVGDRILAYLIDAFFQLSYILIIVFIISMVDIKVTWELSFLALPILLYHLLCEMFLNGQSFGKLIMKIKVVKMNGGELSFGSCFIRWIFRLIEFTLFSGLIALITILINGKGQRLGDIAAGTTVLKVNAKNLLQHTVFMQLPDDYVPRYQAVENLSDIDLRTIKEVLSLVENNHAGYNGGVPHPLLMKTRDAVSKKMGVNPQESSLEFLTTVLKDFNYYNR
ncbi:RDD family protein [Marinilabiliaceae bacterium JC017]|nr:RDD family protein [Marinilabiliaceae bacterium JC017]